MLTPQARSAAQFSGKGKAYAASAGHAHAGALASLVDLVHPQGHERFLDVATGGGHLAHAFAPYVASTVAFDLVDDMLAQARRERVAPVRGMAERLPFRDGSFDIVGCRLAAHHFADVGAFLRESRRVLKPGGRLLIADVTVPEDRDTAVEINRIETLRDPSHGRNLPVSEWRAKLEAAGFAVDHVGVAPFGGGLRMEFDDWTRRIGTPPENLAPLREAFYQADARLRDALRLKTEDGITFELDEATILGTRSA